MSTETYRFKDNFKPIFDDLVVLDNNLPPLKRTHLNLCQAKVKVRFSRGDNFKQTIFSYMPLNICWFSEVSFQLGTR